MTNPTPLPLTNAERIECAELSERLHDLAVKFDALGWERHGAEIRSMAAHIGIYGRQIAWRVIEDKPVVRP